ncbi:NAD-binding protein [candidate division KSB1 bacterium]|nr:NAD-binding protein [candidate division KSB1 bacterium]
MEKITLIGTGLMGAPMVEQLLAEGYPVTIYNRSKEKIEPLTDAGAYAAASVEEALSNSRTIILMLSDAQAIESLIFPDIRNVDMNNRTVIQMGTITSEESIDFLRRFMMVGGSYLEAPVLGSIPQVRNRELFVLVGGSDQQFREYESLLKCFGPQPMHVGPVGKAASLKLAFNQLIASLTASFSLSLGMVLQNDIDVDLFMNILRKSALHAPTFDKKLERMLGRDFSAPHFPTKHLLKDVNLVIREAEKTNLNVDALHGIRKIIEKALKMGLQDMDYSSLYNAVNPDH